MVSTLLQVENINEIIITINNKELYDTLLKGFESNYKVYESIETEKTELTTVKKKLNEEELLLINLIAKKCLVKEGFSKELSLELIHL